MITGIEKSLKRYLKRKVKITVGIVVAFLLSCSLVSADNSILEITEENGNILFNGKVFDEENHEFLGNTFKDNVYVNNSVIEFKSEDESIPISIKNDINDFKFINNNYILSSTESENGDKYGLSIGIDIINESENKLLLIENEGIISIKSDVNLDYNTWFASQTMGITSSGMGKKEINNNGIIETTGGYQGQAVYVIGKLESLRNSGILSSTNDPNLDNQNFGIVTYQDPENPKIHSIIDKIENRGLINAKGFTSAGIRLDMNETKEIINYGNVRGFGVGAYGIEIQGMDSQVENIINNGIIGGSNNAIRITDTTVNNLKNTGTLFSTSSKDTLTVESVNEIENQGMIFNSNGVGVKYFGILNNYGIISANSPIEYPVSAPVFYPHKNLGLYLSEDGKILKHTFENISKNVFEILENQQEETILPNQEVQREISVGGDNNPTLETIKIKNESGKTIINAGSDASGKVLSINSDTIKGLSDEGYILNGFNNVVIIDDNTGDKNINNSIINGVQTAVLIKDGKTLSLDNTTVNGGYNFDIIKGEGANNLNISGTSTINGNVNLGDGKDTLSVTDTVQLNGILNGGEGTEDTLTFNKSSVQGNNINLLYDIQGFEKTTINTDVTLFEKTVNNTGDLTSLKVQMGDIVISDGAKLTLRIDGTEKVNDKITGHALYGNNGSLTTEENGKLILGVYGAGTEMIINFGGTDISNLNSDNVDTTSILHNIAVKDNDIIISAEKDLKDIELENYDKLNNIYHSIYNSQNIDKFTVSEEQYNSFLKYLHDIYAVNPYAFSSELSRKTMGMMRNLADKDLKPELNKWAVYGGLTHIDGGTEESYYGKGYYGYDIGSRDIKADTKITGGYFKAEYGKSDSVTTGLIFGGNNSETEIGASKVEGDSFYFGAYAKKYLNDFRFTFGAGFQHGDYKGDRTAIGYEGVTETRKYSENYHDRGFDIYGNLKYSKDLGNNFFFEPAFTLSYTYLDQDGVEESGILGIDTDSQNFDYVSGELNLDVRKIFAGTVNLHSITAGFSYERMISGYDKEYITGRFAGGTDFDILVPEKEKDIFSLKAKYEFEKENGFIFDVKGQYKFEHDNNQEEWIIGTGIGYKF